MGISPFSRCHGSYMDTGRKTPTVKEYVSVNPDPTKFTIIRIIEGINTYAEIRYPNCTTFEGLKVMVFRGKVKDKLEKAKSIDPHFDIKKMAPIARFEPTVLGRGLALELIDKEL